MSVRGASFGWVIGCLAMGACGGPHAETALAQGPSSSAVVYYRPASGAPYFARFDGKAWAQSALPELPDGPVRETAFLSMGADGAVVLARQGVVDRQTADGAWTRMPLPDAGNDRLVEITGLHVKDTAHVWVTATLTDLRRAEEPSKFVAVFSTVPGDPFVPLSPTASAK